MRFVRLSLLAALCASLLPLAAAAQVRRPMPVVQRLEPTSGPPGTSVSLVGRYFRRDQTVWLGDVELEVVRRLPNRWTVRVPEGAESGRVAIRTSRGEVRGPRFRVTEAAPAPVITDVSPPRGAPGTEVTIAGEHFSPRPSENQVRLGERPVVVRSANPTALRVIVPSGAETAPFTVRVTGAGEATSEAPFEVGTGTAIASFSPTLGPPRTRVTLRGSGFHRRRGRNRVYLGERRARVIRASETELTVEVPRRGAETATWLVDVRGGGRARSAEPFEVRFPPEIEAMEPAFGAPGTRVTLRGAHFGTDVREVDARIGDTQLVVRDLSDERLVVEIPAGAESGRLAVTVAGLGPGRSEAAFRVTERVEVTGFAPRSGGAGTEVTIRGRGFSSTEAHHRVTLSGEEAEILSARPDELRVRIPQARSGPLVVAVDNGGSDRTAQPFVVTRAPTIAAFAPTSGGPGTVVTIRGQNFGRRPGLIRAWLGDARLELRRATDTELEVVVPQGAATGRLRVQVRLQGSAEADADFVVSP
jgi:hypothetical protein